MRSVRSRAVLAALGAIALVAGAGAPAATAAPSGTTAATGPAPAAHDAGPNTPGKPSCANRLMLCTEVYDSESVFGEGRYVGHDEPSLLFYSNQPGAGNRNRWNLTIPKDPPHDVVPGRTWNFQLHPAFWFGMAMCDTESYPEQVKTCAPDSDGNITPLAQHPGTAFMELQFYPPGWVQQFDSQSCDPVRWCAALTIDSLSRDPVAGQDQNAACQGRVLGGLEYVNFAYVSRNGVPNGAPNPLDFDPAVGGRPSPNDLFFNPGDSVEIALRDTEQGLRVDLSDQTTRERGFMVASARNNFGQMRFDPTGTSCTVVPYDFHPMYSTSSEQTRVPWAAHSYNVAFADELGHWDYCTAIAADGTCPATSMEGDPHANSGALNDQEPADADDFACFNPPPPPAVQVIGCNGQNNGFDGVSYHHSWADGDTNLHPTAIQISSPRTGGESGSPYQRVAFEADLPRIEATTCSRLTGIGCTLVPTTDDHQSADFYPFFSKGHVRESCRWALGSFIPGFTENDWGGNVQYGTLLSQPYLTFGGHGSITNFINDYRQILPADPCGSR
jgi:hypothetical protein